MATITEIWLPVVEMAMAGISNLMAFVHEMINHPLIRFLLLMG
jgi:hypothetical protein